MCTVFWRIRKIRNKFGIHKEKYIIVILIGVTISILSYLWDNVFFMSTEHIQPFERVMS